MRMESNKTSMERIVWRSTSEGEEVGEVRLYKCTFCERGFSNAQALGGHMNIHRRDRARLKEFSELEIPSSTSITRDSLSSHQLPSPDYRNFLQSVSSTEHHDHERSCTHKRPSNFVQEDDQDSRRRAAGNLYLERSSTRNRSRSPTFFDEGVEKTTVQRTSSLELDLELRLGPEPHG